MMQSYAYQILGLAVGISALTLACVAIAARVFDRNTRKAEAAARDHGGE